MPDVGIERGSLSANDETARLDPRQFKYVCDRGETSATTVAR